MASVIEFPSSDAVKVLTHVKEWLEEEPTEVPQSPSDPDMISHAFTPMYIMCPLRRQQGDAGVADWVKHALKFAWLRMHKDFVQYKAPIRFELPARTRALSAARAKELATTLPAFTQQEVQAAQDARKAAERAVQEAEAAVQMPPHSDGHPNHPYNSCQTVTDFRRKYGVLVLLYASNQSEEQNMRTSLQNDMEAWELEQELQKDRATSLTSQTESGKGTETNRDGRLLSVLFDPALVENRLASYGEPPLTWTVIERRQRDLEAYLPPIEADSVADGPGEPRTVPLGRQRQPLERVDKIFADTATASQLQAANWVPYGTPLGAGRMIPVAHGFRMENNLQVDERKSLTADGRPYLRHPYTWTRTDPSTNASLPAEPRFRVQKQTQWIPDYAGMRQQNTKSEVELPAVLNPNHDPNAGTEQYYYSEFVFDTTLQPSEMPRLKYRRAGPDEMAQGSDRFNARPYTMDEGYLNPEPTTLEDLNGIVIRHRMDHWPNAQDATRYFLEKFGIHKTMIAGYGMLEAGLTIQSTVKNQRDWFPRNVYGQQAKTSGTDGLDVHWVPKYMSIATSEDGAVDAYYQIIGRCFVDMRNLALPDGWKINFLAARPIYTMIKVYGLLELRLSQIENVTLTHAFAHLAQIMTHPNVLEDNGDREFVHDAVSHLIQHKMHTKAREGGLLRKVLKLATDIPSVSGGIGEWRITLPQHVPSSTAYIVNL